MPELGLKDDAASARVNIDFQAAWARASGHRCAVVVCLFHLLSQDSGARRVYAEGMDPRLFYAAALVVSNPISRAIGTFIGLTRPGVPTAIVGTIDEGIAWCAPQRRRSERVMPDTATWTKFATTSNADYEINHVPSRLCPSRGRPTTPRPPGKASRRSCNICGRAASVPASS